MATGVVQGIRNHATAGCAITAATARALKVELNMSEDVLLGRRMEERHSGKMLKYLSWGIIGVCSFVSRGDGRESDQMTLA